MKKIIILYSGGLDSFLMYNLAKFEYPDADVKCLFIAHGHDSEQAEIESLPDFVIQKSIDWLDDGIEAVSKPEDPFAGAVYIPGRNLMFATMAACLYLPDEIWMGTVWDEDNPKGTDKNEYFREKTSKLLSYVLSPFILEKMRVVFPFVEREWTKEDAVRNALASGVDKQEIIDTISCWHHDGVKPCGTCKQCVKRNLVFRLNGFHEECHQDPFYSPAALALLQDYVDNESTNRDEENMRDMIERLRSFSLHITNDWLREKNRTGSR